MARGANSIKEPTHVLFERQSASNLLVVGQSEEAEVGVACLALVSLAAQFPPGSLRLILCEGTLPGTPEKEFFDRIIQALPHPVLRPARADIARTLNDLALEISRRTGEEDLDKAPATFVVIAGLQRFKQLRPEDEFGLSASPSAGTGDGAASLSTILTEGPSRGFHALVTVDTYGNVARFLGRRGLAEFHSRVLFQMSPNDSASLVDSPEASRLGLHRALLHSEREGLAEKFRPYALTGTNWPMEIAHAFRRRAGGV